MRGWRVGMVVGVWAASQMAVVGPTMAQSDEPVVHAGAAIVMNANTGTILYEKNAFRQMDPASLTKIMTAILVLEHGGLDRAVSISANAAAVEGSKLHVRPGQRYTISDLLRGLLLRSGNDAAIALAEAESGSVARFVVEMNAKAQALGAFNTAFQNPNGLTGSGHYTSAYDLALIARAAMAMPAFRQVVSSREQEIVERASGEARTIRTTNRLLYEFPGADGVKTGTTNAAGQCLIASASQDGYRLIAVVLKSRDRWEDAQSLLSWGFSAWTQRSIYHRGQTIADASVIGGAEPWVALVAARSLQVSLPRGSSVQVIDHFPLRLRAPVRPRVVGYVYVLAAHQDPIRIAVEPAHAVRSRGRIRRWWHRLWSAPSTPSER